MNSFDELLSPADPRQFFLEYWHRKPLLIRGAQDKFRQFPSLNELPSLLNGRLSANRWAKGHAQSAQASFTDRLGQIKSLSAVPTMWPDLFNAGFSLCFSALDQYHEELRALTDCIASTTSYPGTIFTTGYLTPRHSGTSMHFDGHHAFFMQIAGEKHWKVAKGIAWQDAPSNVSLSSLGTPGMKILCESLGVAVATPEDTGLWEATLTPGDVLYLPPGVWHEGHTSESHSLHYTLGFAPLGPWHLAVAYMRQAFFARPALRRDIRFVTESGDGNTTDLIEAALAELRDTINGLTATDLESFFTHISSLNSPLRGYLMQP